MDEIVIKPKTDVLSRLTEAEREAVAREIEWAAHVSSRPVRRDNEIRHIREAVQSMAKSLEYMTGGEKYIRAIEQQTIAILLRAEVLPASPEFENLFARHGLNLRQLSEAFDLFRRTDAD